MNGWYKPAAAASVPGGKLMVPTSPIIPMPAMEELFPILGAIDPRVKEFYGKMLGIKSIKDRILMMSGSLSNYSSAKVFDLLFGKTAYAGETTIYGALYTSAVDDTSHGGTTGEAAYTSYARMSLTNNTTNFGAGSGTTSYSKSFPSDATHSWATSTGGSATVTYLLFLNGNAGTSSDKGICWMSVTSTAIASGDTPQLAQNAVTGTID